MQRLPRWPIGALALRVGLLLLLSLLLSGCSPVAWLVSVPTMSSGELRLRLARGDKLAIFDLREGADYAMGHLPAAESVAFDFVGAATQLIAKDRDLVLACYHGELAALAGPSARGAGHDRVFVLEGGMEQWSAQGGELSRGLTGSLGNLSKSQLHPSLAASVLAYGAGVVIKPVYMLMSLGLILWLRRSRSRDLRLLRMGLIAFLAGESACLLGFYLSDNGVPLQGIEVLHGLGMAIGLAYGLWGAYNFIESRFLSMNDLQRGCALARVCGTCSRQQELLCKPQQQFRYAILLIAPLTLLPWSQELLVRDESAVLFGAVVQYEWPVVNQLIELRLYPALALMALLAAFALLGKRRSGLEGGHRFLFWGLGLLSFSLMKLLLKGTFSGQPYWSDVWEEVTELIAIAGVALFLWVFRQRLELERA